MRSIDVLRLLFGLLLAVGCDENKQKAEASAVPSATVAPTAKVEIAPPRPAPPDIELDSYLNGLKCGKKATSDSCRLLQEFSGAKRWSFSVPSGEGRWVGNAFVREKGVEKKQIMILWAKRMPTAQVGPGDLPLKVGTGTLATELIEHGFKMVRALSSGDQPSKHNQARPQIETFVPNVTRGAVATAGASIRLISEDTVYLRQEGRKILMFSPSLAESATTGDGTYAEFWSSTW